MRPMSNIQVGTLGGTLCSVLGSIKADDIVKTAVLAAVGAAVSFLVSRWLQKKYKPPDTGEGLFCQGLSTKGINKNNC